MVFLLRKYNQNHLQTSPNLSFSCIILRIWIPRAAKIMFFLSKNNKNKRIRHPKAPEDEIWKNSGGQKCYGPLPNLFRKNSNSGPSEGGRDHTGGSQEDLTKQLRYIKNCLFSCSKLTKRKLNPPET